MEITPLGFWDYVEKWRATFPQECAIRWENNWLKNDYCARCRYCCGPQDTETPFPMALLPDQIDADAHKRFFMLDAATACLTAQGCRSDGPQGCKLDLAQKPLACGLFPVVLANGGLYLYKNCPAVVFEPLLRFLDIATNVADLLEVLPYEDLLRISLWYTSEALSRKYIDLAITLFDKDGRKRIHR